MSRADFGGSVGRLERVSKHAVRRSRHRREVWAVRRRAHRRRLAAFLPLAVLGLAILAWQLVQATPTYGLIGLGLLLVLPALVEGFES